MTQEQFFEELAKLDVGVVNNADGFLVADKQFDDYSIIYVVILDRMLIMVVKGSKMSQHWVFNKELLFTPKEIIEQIKNFKPQIV